MLLAGIPVGVYLVQQQQETQSQAEASSTLSFVPTSSEAAPIEVGVGDVVKLDLTVNPGSNKVSVVAFEINYDPAVLTPSETTPFVENKTDFPVVIDPPVYEDGIIRGRVSTENVGKSVSTTTKVGTVTFTALAETTLPTVVSYGAPFTQILSAGAEDEAAENVLSSSTPAYITVVAEGTTTTPAPTGPDGQPQPTSTAVSPTTIPKGGVPGNTAPICTSLTANGATSGVAPFAAAFSSTANDPDGSVEKVTFNFGDGQTKDVLSTETTASGSATTFATEYTYTTTGTFKATAIATDNSGGISGQGECELTMTVTSAVSPTQVPDVPAATMEPTGPAETFIGIGIVAGILTFLGGILFFTL